MNTMQRKFTMCGGLFGLIYLLSNRVAPNLPELLMGLVVGLGMTFLVLSLLPEETLKKLRKWKRRG